MSGDLQGGTRREGATSARPEGRAKSFGLSVGAVCGLLAVVGAWRGHMTASLIWGLFACALIGPALVRPAWLNGPSAVWWRFAHALGWVNSRILLTLFFFAVVTPVGVAWRVMGRDPLRRRKPRGSGWAPYPERFRDPAHYGRMY